jgi:F420-dependent oxidoreductase-like protein
MRIGMMLKRADTFRQTADDLVDYENAGLELVAVPEAYTFDAVSQLGYLAARTTHVSLAAGILPIYTRTPALTAMTAAGLDHVSEGRFLLGLGASGPQVIEGFHGVPYDAPLGRTRELIEICRMVWRREPLRYDGRHYRIPLPARDAGATEVRALKLVDHPLRERIPISVAALGPRNVALTAEVAEGWQPVFFHPERADGVWGAALREGMTKRLPVLGPLEVMVQAVVGIGDAEPEALATGRRELALYLGGMGPRGRNFYNDLAVAYGYPDAAREVQDLYLDGDREGAAAAVPEALLRAVTLIGTPAEVARQLGALARAGVTTVLARPVAGDHAGRVAQISRLRELAAELPLRS